MADALPWRMMHDSLVVWRCCACWVIPSCRSHFALPSAVIHVRALCMQIKTRLEVAADERGTKVCSVLQSASETWHALRDQCHHGHGTMAHEFVSGCAWLDIRQEVKDAKEVALPSGVRYTDLVIGGGQRASPGLLMVLNLKCGFDKPVNSLRQT